ncbi:ATP-dependent DNA ligase, partial [Streptomyces sp. NPDC058953]
MLLARLAEVSRDVADASARSRKTELLAGLFADTAPDEAARVVSYLSGRLPQGRIGIGWSALKDRPPPAAEPTLTVAALDAALTGIAAATGPGSRAVRARELTGLLAAATAPEQEFLTRLLLGEVRQGALDAVASEAVARAGGAAPGAVRRAVMLDGSLPRVAAALLADGPAALGRFRLRVGRPVLPMLAHTAASVTEAVTTLGTVCAVEEKLDGIRVQVHREGSAVHVFTRSLDDITDRLPEVVTAALGAAGDGFVGDRRGLAPGPGGRPRPLRA